MGPDETKVNQQETRAWGLGTLDGDQRKSCHRLLRNVEEVRAKLRLQESQYEKLSNKILPKRRSREQDDIRLDIRLIWMETSILQSSMSIHDSRTFVVRDIADHKQHTSDKLAQVNQETQNWFHHMTHQISLLSRSLSPAAVSTLHTSSDASEAGQITPNGAPALGKLFKLCITGLEIVYARLKSRDFKDLSLQLQAWAFGLLEGPHSLNIVIWDSEIAGMEQNHHPPWAMSLMAAFCRILLGIEIIFRALDLNDADSTEFLRQASLTVNKLPLTANTVDGPNMSAMTKEQAAAEHVASCAESISICIDRLFQLIPAIEVVRDFHCFQPVILSNMTTAWIRRGETESMPVDDLTDHVVYMIGTVAKEAENRARMEEKEGKEEKSLMDRIAGLFKDEAGKLEDWKAQNGSSIDPAEMEQTRAGLFTLEKSLMRWTEDYKQVEGAPGTQKFSDILGKVQEEVQGLTFVSSLVKGKGKGAEMLSASGDKRRGSMEIEATGTGGGVSGTQASQAAPRYGA